VLGPATGASVVLFGRPATCLTGVQFFDFCEYPGVLTNEIGVVGTSPARTRRRRSSAERLQQHAAHQVVNCAGGTMPTVNIQTCQDSSLTDTNECPAPSATNFASRRHRQQHRRRLRRAHHAAAASARSSGSPPDYPTVERQRPTARVHARRSVQRPAVAVDDPITSATASGTVLDYNNTIGTTSRLRPSPVLPARAVTSCAAATSRAGSWSRRSRPPTQPARYYRTPSRR
jgi:hypothetical protein